MVPYTNRHPRPAAFTLIELLVAITIITLLIALLMPTLRAARGTAQLVQCLSNQRQIGILMATYNADNTGWTPDYSVKWRDGGSGWRKGVNVEDAGRHGDGYANKLAHYYLDWNLADGRYNMKASDTRLTIFTCPNETDVPGLDAPLLSYQPNYTGGPARNEGAMGIFINFLNNSARATMSNLDAYENPSAYFFLLEMNQPPILPHPFYAQWVGYPYNNTAARYRQRVRWRSDAHGGASRFTTLGGYEGNDNGASTVLFADMHAQSLNARQLAFPAGAQIGNSSAAEHLPGGQATARNWILNDSAQRHITLQW